MPVIHKSSRVGNKNYKTPPPLRFKSVKDAKAHIKANRLKITEHHSHMRGAHIQVVNKKGKPRTISIELPSRNGNE
jgi:hypothetical protein